jgi:hypothetical protein
MLHQLHLIPFLLCPVSKRHPLTHIVETLMLIPTVCLSKVTRGSTPHSTVRVSVNVRVSVWSMPSFSTYFSVGSCICVSILVYLGVPLQIGS